MFSNEYHKFLMEMFFKKDDMQKENYFQNSLTFWL